MFALYQQVYSQTKALSENNFMSMGYRYEKYIGRAMVESYLGFGYDYYHDISTKYMDYFNPVETYYEGPEKYWGDIENDLN